MSRTIVELSRTPSKQLKNKDKWQKLLPSMDPQFEHDKGLIDDRNEIGCDDED